MSTTSALDEPIAAPVTETPPAPEPTPAPVTPPAPSEPASISDYVPTENPILTGEINDPNFELTGPASPDVEPTPPAQTPEAAPQSPEVQPTGEKKELTPEEKAARKEANNHLRKQFDEYREEAKSKYADYDAQIEKLNQQREEIEAAKAAVQKSLDEREQSVANLQRQLGARDAQNHPEVQKMLAGIGEREKTLQRRLGKDAPKLKQNIQTLALAYKALPDFDDEGYAEAYEAFEDKVKESFPTNVDRVIDFIQDRDEAMSGVEAKISELTLNGQQFAFDEAKRQHEEFMAVYDKAVANQFKPSDDMKNSNPAHTRVFLHGLIESDREEAFLEGGKPGDLAARAKGISEAMRYCMNPLPPVSPEDLASVPPEQQEAALQVRQRDHMAKRQEFLSIASEAVLAWQLMPAIQKNFANLKARLESMSKERPTPNPKPSSSLPTEEPPIKQTDDITRYQSSNPELEALGVKGLA